MHNSHEAAPLKYLIRKVRGILAASTVLCVLAGCAATPQGSDSPPPASQSLNAPQSQQVFATPEAAVDALVTATRHDRKDDLLKILGPDAGELIYSGDKVADKAAQDQFITAYDRAHEIKNDSPDHDTLVVGDEEWPLPIPLVHAANGWWFDSAAGREEILDRRIGRNELNVLQICGVYVEAQREFFALNRHGPVQHEYAQRFHSSPGRHDGLYWPARQDGKQSPLGPLLASAADEGYSGKVLSKHAPYHGYYYRILKRQGAHAAGGEKDYVIDGHMTGGFALIAFPDRYGDSGVMTFIVNQNGIVYEKDLGFDTVSIAKAVTQFDPDDSWNIVQQ